MLKGHDFPQKYGEKEITATDAIFGKEGRDQSCNCIKGLTKNITNGLSKSFAELQGVNPPKISFETFVTILIKKDYILRFSFVHQPLKNVALTSRLE